MEKTKRGFKLSSGREFYANGHILGISDSFDEISYGYDGTFGDVDDPFTAEEVSEIADYMISLWAQYKAQVGK